MSAPKPVAAKTATKAAAKVPAQPARRAKSGANPATKPVVKPVAKVAAKPPARPVGEVSVEAMKLAATIDRALANGDLDLLSPEAVQALMAAVCRSYAAQIEAGNMFPPIGDRSRVTSTDVMVTASGLLKSANLAVFELGMWQSWTGR
jgi:hypothetical protein